MLFESLIRDLEYTIEKNRGKFVATGEVRVDIMAKDCLDAIKYLQQEVFDLKKRII